jgi:hypothetical protein
MVCSEVEAADGREGQGPVSGNNQCTGSPCIVYRLTSLNERNDTTRTKAGGYLVLATIAPLLPLALP